MQPKLTKNATTIDKKCNHFFKKMYPKLAKKTTKICKKCKKSNQSTFQFSLFVSFHQCAISMGRFEYTGLDSDVQWLPSKQQKRESMLSSLPAAVYTRWMKARVLTYRADYREQQQEARSIVLTAFSQKNRFSYSQKQLKTRLSREWDPICSLSFDGSVMFKTEYLIKSHHYNNIRTSLFDIFCCTAVYITEIDKNLLLSYN